METMKEKPMIIQAVPNKIAARFVTYIFTLRFHLF